MSSAAPADLGGDHAHAARAAALLDTLRRSYDGDAWHGPALADVLRGVDAPTAAAHPIPGAHSIWELTRHVVAWTREVTRRLDGSPPAEPADGDWPPVPAGHDANEGAWRALRTALDEARDELLAAVAALPAAQLDRELPRPPEADAVAAGRSPTYMVTLTGLAEHNAYHGGQIALLRRAVAPAAGLRA